MKTKIIIITILLSGLIRTADSQVLVCTKGGIGYNSFIGSLRLFSDYSITSTHKYFYPFGVDVKLRKYKLINPGISFEYFLKSYSIDITSESSNRNFERDLYESQQFALTLYPELSFGETVKYHFNFGLCLGFTTNSTLTKTITLYNSLNQPTYWIEKQSNGSYLTDLNFAIRLGTGFDIPIYKGLYVNLDFAAQIGSHGINNRLQNPFASYSVLGTFGVSYLFGYAAPIKKVKVDENPSVLHP